MIAFFDIEFTCWEDSLPSNWSNPTRPAEMIELGMVIYCPERDAVEQKARVLVRPKINPILSKYCTQLTGITQEEINQADALNAVNEQVQEWINPYSIKQYMSWGEEDLLYWQNDSKRNHTHCPIPAENYLDLMRVFSEDEEGMGRTEAAALHNIQRPPIKRHRALEDALDLIPFYQTGLVTHE